MLGNRIQRARKAKGFSLRDLAEEIGLSHAAIKKYEDNEVTPSSDILIKLAKALNVKVEYFFRPNHFSLVNIQYRTHADMPEQQRDMITVKILDQIESRIELENVFPSSPIQEFKELTLGAKKINHLDDMEDIANSLRKKWNLGLEPLPSLIDIFEERGIKVFEIDNRQYPKFDGLFVRINNMPVIVIGNHWQSYRQRFTLAHELGHLIFNGFFHPFFKDKKNNEEECCNRFAGAFLLPKESLVKILGEHRNNIEVRELGILKEEFGISIMSILHRLEEAGIISNKRYLQLRSEYNERGWEKKEPSNQKPKEKTYFFEQMIFHALAEEFISESKAAELMNISIEDFRSLRAMESQNVAHNK